jgi:hypothetical protein
MNDHRPQEITGVEIAQSAIGRAIIREHEFNTIKVRMLEQMLNASLCGLNLVETENGNAELHFSFDNPMNWSTVQLTGDLPFVSLFISKGGFFSYSFTAEFTEIGEPIFLSAFFAAPAVNCSTAC